MGRFKYLLFVAICIALPGIERKAHASVRPASDGMTVVPVGVIGSPANNLASSAFAAHSSDHSHVRTGNATANSASGSASKGTTSTSSDPLILYTDITSGPNSGGERNDGSYLTIFGTHFGATRGISTVTINGRAVAQYRSATSRLGRLWSPWAAWSVTPIRRLQ